MNEQKVTNNAIICNRCGSEMKVSARYCMKCGNLNYSHPDNQNMIKYAPVGSQKEFIPPAKSEVQSITDSLKYSMYYDGESIRKCITFNIAFLMLSLLLIIVGIVGSVSSLSYQLSMIGLNISISPFPIIILSSISFFVFWFMTLARQLVLQKAGESWWGGLIPIYNGYLLAKVGFGNGWLFLTFIFIIPSFICFYKIGKKFYQSGLLTMFFPYIMIPVIAFNKNVQYSMLAKNNDVDQNNTGITKSEVDYKQKKIILSILGIVSLGIVLYFTWPIIKSIGVKLFEFFMKQLEFYK